MLDFDIEHNLRSVIEQRERESREAARFAGNTAPRSVRARLTSRLTRLAGGREADAIKRIVTPDPRIPRHHHG